MRTPTSSRRAAHRRIGLLGDPPPLATPPGGHEAGPTAAPAARASLARRPLWYADLPLEELAAAPFPKLVVSGGHSGGFDAICDDLAERIGASRAVVEGAGHEIQFAGAPINDTLLAHWRAGH